MLKRGVLPYPPENNSMFASSANGRVNAARDSSEGHSWLLQVTEVGIQGNVVQRFADAVCYANATEGEADLAFPRSPQAKAQTRGSWGVSVQKVIPSADPRVVRARILLTLAGSALVDRVKAKG